MKVFVTVYQEHILYHHLNVQLVMLVVKIVLELHHHTVLHVSNLFLLVLSVNVMTLISSTEKNVKLVMLLVYLVEELL